MNFIKKIVESVNRLLEYSATFLLFLAVAFVIVQVTLRFFFRKGGLVPWVWESVIVCNLFITYIGATVLAKDKEHIALTIHEHFPKSIRRVLGIIVNVIVIFTSSLVAVKTIGLVERQLGIALPTVPFLSRGHESLLIVIGFALIAIYSFLHFISPERGR